jgi:hypothetical protein
VPFPDLRKPFGVARVMIGTGMLLAPGSAGRLWWGVEMTPAASAVLRGMGARDAIIGAGTAFAGPASASQWLRAGVGADASDGLAAALAGGLPSARRLLTAAFAVSGLVAGLVLDRAQG